MIISHAHRYIFFAIPKTGTHSVRQALRAHMGEQDMEQVQLFEGKRFPFPEFADIRHGHISTQQIRPVLGDETFKNYFKFAFVRNPFDRFVSYCAFMSRGTNVFQAEPQRYMKYIIRELKPVDHLLYQPQHCMVCNERGELELDFVGRNETMQASFDEACAKIGIPSASLGRVNASKHRPWQEYYDPDLVGWVSDLYRRDLELFNYRFDA
jgi:hypothetical protein